MRQPCSPVTDPRPSTPALERRLGDWARARLPPALADLVMFVLKQGWACLFGGLLLIAMIGTRAVWDADWPIHRYDALLAFALLVQVAFLRFGLETWAEARVILLFHLTGTVMEWFKIAQGSWSYPDPALFSLMGVPLFSGFMYASVGSYMARVIRIFDMRFAPYPPFWVTLALAAAIYANFFSHHFLPDIRVVLLPPPSSSTPAPASISASTTPTAGCRCPSPRSSPPWRSGWPKTWAPRPAHGSTPANAPANSSVSPSSEAGISSSTSPS